MTRLTASLHVSIVLLTASLLLLCVAAYRPYPDPGPDIPPGKPFCATRWPASERCCEGRKDRCTAPILDTICYCDEFCDRTISDCCPDYWTLCRGLTWPPTLMPPLTTRRPQPILWTTRAPAPTRPNIVNNCMKDGLTHTAGDRVKLNCNNCTCVSDGLALNWKCSQVTCLIQSDVIEHVNSGRFGWRAGNHSDFWSMSLSDGINLRLGTFHPLRKVELMTSLRVDADDVLPESFDARQEWPGLIGGVDDQGNCASSWAFSTTSVAADRIRIASSGKLRESLSAQHLISCNVDHMQRGCQGGHLDRAWWYMRHFGVSSADCYPYTSGKTDSTGPCLMPRKPPPNNLVNCTRHSPATSRIYQATPPYRIAPKENEIMKELMDNGPVQATMEVKDDFFMYRSGVYRHSSPPSSSRTQGVTSQDTPRTGFHSVRIIGWGTDRSVSPALNYWLCVNSWGRGWGEQGYFRIARGNNEAHIESFVVGVWGKVSGRVLVPRRSTTRGRYGRHKRLDSRPTNNRHRQYYWKDFQDTDDSLDGVQLLQL